MPQSFCSEEMPECVQMDLKESWVVLSMCQSFSQVMKRNTNIARFCIKDVDFVFLRQSINQSNGFPWNFDSSVS